MSASTATGEPDEDGHYTSTGGRAPSNFTYDRPAGGNYRNWQFYFDGIDFICQFADRFHHAKEEDVLFKALIDNGMPKDHSPVAAMLMEHDQGRCFVRAMEAAVRETQSIRTDTCHAIAENALG